jgi:Tfp pilus assembly protein PilE
MTLYEVIVYIIVVGAITSLLVSSYQHDQRQKVETSPDGEGYP